MKSLIIGLPILGILSWGFILFFKFKKIWALGLIAIWSVSVFLLYRNFSIGTEAAFGMAPNNLLAIVLVFAMIIIGAGVPLFLAGFVPFYYMKLR